MLILKLSQIYSVATCLSVSASVANKRAMLWYTQAFSLPVLAWSDLPHSGKPQNKIIQNEQLLLKMTKAISTGCFFFFFPQNKCDLNSPTQSQSPNPPTTRSGMRTCSESWEEPVWTAKHNNGISSQLFHLDDNLSCHGLSTSPWQQTSRQGEVSLCQRPVT